jgi:hypothetical protein
MANKKIKIYEKYELNYIFGFTIPEIVGYINNVRAARPDIPEDARLNYDEGNSWVDGVAYLSWARDETDEEYKIRIAAKKQRKYQDELDKKNRIEILEKELERLKNGS